MTVRVKKADCGVAVVIPAAIARKLAPDGRRRRRPDNDRRRPRRAIEGPPAAPATACHRRRHQARQLWPPACGVGEDAPGWS